MTPSYRGNYFLYLFMKNLLNLFIVTFFTATLSFSQVTVGTNNPPDPSAVLDIQSSSKGFLLPRLTTAQRNAIVSPAISLSIYNTTTNCYQIYFPLSGWRDVACDCQNSPSSAFTFPNSISQGAPAAFVATTPGMTYSWTFQSGTPATSTQQTENVTWAVAGSYTVSLTVTDNNGCSSTTTQTITVVNCPIPGGNSTTFNYTGNIQTWTVPPGICDFIVDARGAQGANGSNGTGGRGARIVGTFSAVPGTVIQILVGQQGQTATVSGGHIGNSPGGGGGSFVVDNGQPLAVAGGGGAGGAVSAGLDASVTTTGVTGSGPGGNGGGTGGNGGQANGGFNSGQGGGGLLTNGGAPSGDSAIGGPGFAFVNGGAGGSNGAHAGGGGYGGGGGGGNYGGGGGGGYSGGGGGSSNGYGGGGGGSFNGGTSQTNTPGFQTGNGQVIITW